MWTIRTKMLKPLYSIALSTVHIVVHIDVDYKNYSIINIIDTVTNKDKYEN